MEGEAIKDVMHPLEWLAAGPGIVRGQLVRARQQLRLQLQFKHLHRRLLVVFLI